MVNGSVDAGGDGAGGGSRKGLGESLGSHAEIGRKLKQYFDDVVSEGVPDRFSQLLSQLERTEPSSTSGAPRGKD